MVVVGNGYTATGLGHGTMAHEPQCKIALNFTDAHGNTCVLQAEANTGQIAAMHAQLVELAEELKNSE